MKILNVSHANCADGAAAAAVVQEWAEAEGHTYQYFGGVYNDKNFDELRAIIEKGPTRVIITDFSYKPEYMARLLSFQNVTELVWLDHHESAIKAWQEFNANIGHLSLPIPGDYKLEVVLDETKSGALLAWEWCRPGIQAPLPIRLVSDRDLWQFKLEFSRPFHAYMSGKGLNREHYREIIHDWPLSAIGDVCRRGEAVLEYIDAQVSEILNHAEITTLFDGSVVAVFNCPYKLASEAGHKAWEKFKGQIDFTLSYYISGHDLYFSARVGDDGTMNVGAWAKEHFGGGGHPKAAGFMIRECLGMFPEGILAAEAK